MNSRDQNKDVYTGSVIGGGGGGVRADNAEIRTVIKSRSLSFAWSVLYSQPMVSTVRMCTELGGAEVFSPSLLVSVGAVPRCTPQAVCRLRL